jgi:hypothetical protein
MVGIVVENHAAKLSACPTIRANGNVQLSRQEHLLKFGLASDINNLVDFGRIGSATVRAGYL